VNQVSFALVRATMATRLMRRLWFAFLAVVFLAPLRAEEFIVVDSLAALRSYATQSHVKVRLKPGTYRLDTATDHHFVRFTGHDSHFDLHGVKLLIDTQLFRRFGTRGGGDFFYCAIDLVGDRIVFEGLATENYGDQPGIQGKNKIFNITGAGVVLRDVDVTTSGSSPWGYGSLYGISGGDVRKMNGIRVGYPAVGAKLINCRVHMRAMGHGIFIQGAVDTLIEGCRVDGLLKTTEDILAEKSGYAFAHGFKSTGETYVEGVTVGDDGTILPGEMISLSEDGIRLYDQGGGGHPTGHTTIRNCTVLQMRRGICVGLNEASDTVVNCEVRDCVAAGFNLGRGDVLEHCRADAKYSEALSLAQVGAKVDLEILDSRGGRANTILATINGQRHDITLQAKNPEFVPAGFTIEIGTRRGYAFYQRGAIVAEGIKLKNDTAATVMRR
jgi:hypothetical protein